MIEAEWERLARALLPHVPPRVIADLDVRLGRSGPVLAAAAAEHDAGLLILGGKHHGMVGRWFGSTAHYAVRRADLPILITTPDIGDVRRVLIAADLSHAAAPTIAVAERFAALFEARVRALHVIEPLPPLATLDGSLTTYDFVERTEQTLQRETWPLLQSPNAEVLVRHGTPHVVIADVAREWNADVIVVGSHGRGWVDRMLLGSTTERLLNRLPASLLVVPVHSPTGGATFENATAMKESR
jgi:nucleotide-binding universal stress UspA family protein